MKTEVTNLVPVLVGMDSPPSGAHRFAAFDSGHPWPSPCGYAARVQIGSPADLL